MLTSDGPHERSCSTCSLSILSSGPVDTRDSLSSSASSPATLQLLGVVPASVGFLLNPQGRAEADAQCSFVAFLLCCSSSSFLGPGLLDTLGAQSVNQRAKKEGSGLEHEVHHPDTRAPHCPANWKSKLASDWFSCVSAHCFWSGLCVNPLDHREVLRT